ncbi:MULTISPECIES: tRNA pseudouridine(55) synthase TruB [unclassified Diaminobutyricimonas]|uniref:tRNA pseudouridine(55) synthase TruB n=1 Tax=unclassified Diaminobutyricimonas TaxID=2643261 RepID=UPI0012F508B1|nr:MULTISPECIES: tRNA pseudouridine(55) synthase TruB [unclassified Diaminobutyricimonas]
MGEIGKRSGILLLDKPAGLTSHDVVARVRRLAGTRKVGHAGTLDPMATGLLVLGLNSSTRLLTYLVGLDKEYTATIRLGQTSTTDDAEGELGETTDTTGISDDAIAAGIAALTGPIEQVPSSVSAIKVDGRRAYDRARAGETVELKSRPVTIHEFEVLDIRRGDHLDIDVRVVCSSGTYIRALARDLGGGLGVGGHLTVLRRTLVGPFAITDAGTLTDATPDGLGDGLLDPAAVAATLFPTVQLDADETKDLTNGKRITLDAPDAACAAALSPDGRLIGLLTLTNGRARALVNFPTDEVLS